VRDCIEDEHAMDLILRMMWEDKSNNEQQTNTPEDTTYHTAKFHSVGTVDVQQSAIE
jgi:hypothetical protein